MTCESHVFEAVGINKREMGQDPGSLCAGLPSTPWPSTPKNLPGNPGFQDTQFANHYSTLSISLICRPAENSLKLPKSDKTPINYIVAFPWDMPQTDIGAYSKMTLTLYLGVSKLFF